CCLSRTRRLPPISTSFPYTTLFRSQKKSKQRKGEPKSGPLRGSLRCSRRGGNSQTCPLRVLRTCEFLIPTPLRCSARPHGKVGSGSGSGSGSGIGSGLPLARPVPSLPRPSGERAGVGGGGGGGGAGGPAPPARPPSLPPPPRGGGGGGGGATPAKRPEEMSPLPPSPSCAGE